MTACDQCLRRGYVLELLAGFIEVARHERNGLRDVLSLDDETLVRAVGGQRTGELLRRLTEFEPESARVATERAGLSVVCRHRELFPARLRDDPSLHAVYVGGGQERFSELADAAGPAVAIVGTRRASPEGTQTARELGRGLAAAGITVVSGMALGVDSAAHEGALDGGGNTLAVLSVGADVSYPRSKSALHRRITAQGAVISEMPAGAGSHRWGFPARNRIIAALAQATIVVEAASRSGSLITSDFALDLGREVLAVPGSVRSWRADGTNALIRDGATLVRNARDVLDAILGADMADHAQARAAETFVAAPPGLEPATASVLSAVERGIRRTDELIARGGAGPATLAGLAELELLGLIRRVPGGGYERARV